MFERRWPNDFRAVPYDAVTVTGHYVLRLNTAANANDVRCWALLAPNGRAVDAEGGARPHRYANLEECALAAAQFSRDGCSTCGPAWEPPGAGPCKDYEHASESGMGDVALMLGWESPDDDQGFWHHEQHDNVHDSDLRPLLIEQLQQLLASSRKRTQQLQALDTYKEWHPCQDDACVVCHPVRAGGEE